MILLLYRRYLFRYPSPIFSHLFPFAPGLQAQPSPWLPAPFRTISSQSLSFSVTTYEKSLEQNSKSYPSDHWLDSCWDCSNSKLLKLLRRENGSEEQELGQWHIPGHWSVESCAATRICENQTYCNLFPLPPNVLRHHLKIIRFLYIFAHNCLEILVSNITRSEAVRHLCGSPRRRDKATAASPWPVSTTLAM